MPSSGKQLQGLVGLMPNLYHLYLCLQGWVGTVLRLGWWTNISPNCVTNLIAGPQGCLQCTPTHGLAKTQDL